MAGLTAHRLVLGGRAVTLLEGPGGWGECSPLPGYPCDPASARAAAEEAALGGWPPPVRDAVPVNALVGDDRLDPEALRTFPAVKVKVRTPAHVDRVARVRDLLGPHVGVRADMNGAFDVDTALEVLRGLTPYDLEYVEQPVTTLEDLARVRRRVDVRVAADECVRSVADAGRLAALGAADVVVLKVQPLGGVRAALAVADAARVPAVVTSMLETSVGVAAGLALAAALAELPYACGLATVDPAADVTDHPLVPEDGMLRVRDVLPSPALLARHAASSDATATGASR